jgi:hypothetical protein
MRRAFQGATSLSPLGSQRCDSPAIQKWAREGSTAARHAICSSSDATTTAKPAEWASRGGMNAACDRERLFVGLQGELA